MHQDDDAPPAHGPTSEAASLELADDDYAHPYQRFLQLKDDPEYIKHANSWPQRILPDSIMEAYKLRSSEAAKRGEAVSISADLVRLHHALEESWPLLRRMHGIDGLAVRGAPVKNGGIKMFNWWYPIFKRHSMRAWDVMCAFFLLALCRCFSFSFLISVSPQGSTSSGSNASLSKPAMVSRTSGVFASDSSAFLLAFFLLWRSGMKQRGGQRRGVAKAAS